MKSIALVSKGESIEMGARIKREPSFIGIEGDGFFVFLRKEAAFVEFPSNGELGNLVMGGRVFDDCSQRCKGHNLHGARGLANAFEFHLLLQNLPVSLHSVAV